MESQEQRSSRRGGRIEEEKGENNEELEDDEEKKKKKKKQNMIKKKKRKINDRWISMIRSEILKYIHETLYEAFRERCCCKFVLQALKTC